MTKFPNLLIVRYYDDGNLELTYSDNLDQKYIDSIYEKLHNEANENKHLEKSEIFIKGEGIYKEEDRKNIYSLN